MLADFLFDICPRFIRLPPSTEYYTLSQDFLQSGNVDKTILAIYNTHIEIDLPINSTESYLIGKAFIRKMSSVVDAQKRFRFLSNHIG